MAGPDDAGQRAGRLLEPEGLAAAAGVGARPATSVDSVGVARPWPTTSSSERRVPAASHVRRRGQQDDQADGERGQRDAQRARPSRTGR